MDFYNKALSVNNISSPTPELAVNHATGLEEHPSCLSDMYLGYVQTPTIEIVNAIEGAGIVRLGSDRTQLLQAIQKLIANAAQRQLGSASAVDVTDPTNPSAIATGFTNLLSAQGVHINFSWKIQENNSVFRTFLIQGCASFVLDTSSVRQHNWQWGGVFARGGSTASTTEAKVGGGTGNTAFLTLTNFGNAGAGLILGTITGIIIITNTTITVSFEAFNLLGTLNGSTVNFTATTF